MFGKEGKILRGRGERERESQQVGGWGGMEEREGIELWE